MSKATWIIFGAICVAVLGGLIFVSRQGQISVSDVEQNQIVAASEQNGNIGDHVEGPKTGKTILIEYGDFQCPACGAQYPILKEINKTFEGKLTFIFRNNPLTTLHPNAKVAAAAAEAAGLQGKYWEMHDKLYEKQRDWSNASIDERVSFFERYATEIGVKDINKFKGDMQSKQVEQKINFDLALGRKVPVKGTPTLLLDGKLVEDNVRSDVDKFKQAIEDALK